MTYEVMATASGGGTITLLGADGTTAMEFCTIGPEQAVDLIHRLEYALYDATGTKPAEREHRIYVESNRVMIVKVDERRRTVEMDLPGNYDMEPTTYTVNDGPWAKKGKVLGTRLKGRRNIKRVGSPKRARRTAR